jgi:hypothetical protein
MNGMQAAKQNIIHYPIAGDVVETPEEKSGFFGKLKGWLFRRLHDLGVLTMSDTPTRQGWNINPTSITALLAILGTIAALFLFTWNTAKQSGITEEQNRQRDAQILLLQQELKKAKDLQLLNAQPPLDHNAGKEKK